jgi:hypothetical protein
MGLSGVTKFIIREKIMVVYNCHPRREKKPVRGLGVESNKLVKKG